MGLPAIAIAATIASTAIASYGAVQSADASSAAAIYQSQVAQNNAQIAAQSAKAATQAGDIAAQESDLKNARLQGQLRAELGASGIDADSGTPLDLQRDAAMTGRLDSMTIRNNAARSAYGYTVQGLSDSGQSGLDTATASNDATAGVIGASSSILGGASSVSDKWLKFNQTGVNVLGGSGSSAPTTATP